LGNSTNGFLCTDIPYPGREICTSVHKRTEDALKRLARVEGHVHAIAKMVREDRDCPMVLLQIQAVEAALGKIAGIVLEDHISSCVTRAIKEGRGEKSIRDLTNAVAQLL